MAETDFSLVDGRGRKYLTLQERTRFLDAVRGDPRPEVQTFALTLVHTGCRISGDRPKSGDSSLHRRSGPPGGTQ